MLTAQLPIFRLRKGLNQKFLELCKAIFITTNPKLARASTQFFNEEYGISDAPICMVDHVFTTLVWLKAVKKRPDLPKECLVANCFAATNPSDLLWGKYITEASKLREKGNITPEDYTILVHTLDARNKLMSMTEGEPDVFYEGSVSEILTYAKQRLIEEAHATIEEQTSQLNRLNRRIDDFLRGITGFVRKTVQIGMIVIIFPILLLALLLSTPEGIWHIERIKKSTAVELAAPALIAFLFLATLLNIIFGTKLVSFVNRLAISISTQISVFLQKRFRG